MHIVSRDIVRALDAFSNETRLLIVDELYINGELSFTSLLKKLGIEKATLTFHLKKLTAAGILEHFYRHTLGDDKYSYYGLTTFGKRIFLKITDALIPKPVIRIEKPNSIADFYGELIKDTETELDLPEMPSGSTAYTITLDTRGDTIVASCDKDVKIRIFKGSFVSDEFKTGTDEKAVS